MVKTTTMRWFTRSTPRLRKGQTVTTMADYTLDHPCEWRVDDPIRRDENNIPLSKACGKPTVFVHIAAPGTGRGYSCTDGHYVGTCRELTIVDVI